MGVGASWVYGRSKKNGRNKECERGKGIGSLRYGVATYLWRIGMRMCACDTRTVVFVVAWDRWLWLLWVL